MDKSILQTFWVTQAFKTSFTTTQEYISVIKNQQLENIIRKYARHTNLLVYFLSSWYQ